MLAGVAKVPGAVNCVTTLVRNVRACLKSPWTVEPGRGVEREMNAGVCMDLLGFPSVWGACGPRRARSPDDAICIVERGLGGRPTVVVVVVVQEEVKAQLWL